MRKLLLLISVVIIVLLSGCNLFKNTDPIANFICISENLVINTPINFDASGSYDKENGKNLFARWDFNNDGIWEIDYRHGKKVSDIVSHSYSVPGKYIVKLEVRDTTNKTAISIKEIMIQSNTAPQADFTIDPLIAATGQQVTFNASASADTEDGSNLKARWDFNSDGVWEIDYASNKKVTDIVTYTYSNPGTYNVTLEVMDQFSVKSMKAKSITVLDAQVSSILKGYIVESRGGSGIANAQVAISNESGTIVELMTASDGSFVTNLVPGKYQVVVTKNGYAVSKVQDLIFISSKEFKLELPLKERFYPEWSLGTPLISINGLADSTPKSPLSGEINFTVQSVATLGIKVIEVRFGQEGLDAEKVIYGKNSYDVRFNTNLLPDGESYFKISIYDANNNYVETYKTIYVRNESLISTLNKPYIIELGAITFGQSIGLMREESKIITLKGKGKIDLNQALKTCRAANTTMITMLEWGWVSGASGYKIYRSFTEGTDYRIIGTTSKTYFIDTSALLKPGQPVYYRVSAFDGNLESELSDDVYTVPLAPFNVFLQSPVQGQTLGNSLPNFTWTYDQSVGNSQEFHLIVQGVTDLFISMEAYLNSVGTTLYDGYPLQSGKEYEWDIVEAYAISEYSTKSYAMSLSGQGAGSINGAFRFVTNF